MKLFTVHNIDLTVNVSMIQRTGRVPEHVFSGAAMVLDPAQLFLTMSVVSTVIVLYLEVLVYSRKYLCVHSLHKSTCFAEVISQY